MSDREGQPAPTPLLRRVLDAARRAGRVFVHGENELEDRRWRCPDCGSALENSDGLYRQAQLFGGITPNDTQLRMHCPTHGRPPFNQPV